MRKIGLVAALTSMLVVAVAIPATAGDHGERRHGMAGSVRILDVVDVLDGQWTASGSAVQKRLVCPSGSSASEYDGLTLTKVLTCDESKHFDGDDTFTLTADLAFNDDMTLLVGRWRVVKADGEGKFENVIGHGKMRIRNTSNRGEHHDFHSGVMSRTRR